MFHEHGHETILLSDATTLDENQALATVSIPWTADDEPAVTGDVYTACARLVFPNPDIVGDLSCVVQDAN